MIDPEGDAPLSIEEAAKAYADVPAEQAPDPGQAEADDTEEGDTADVEDAELSDEDGEETDEGETDEEGETEDDSADEPESDHGRFVAKNGKVKLEDGSVVTISELIDGNLRQSDYTRKTMAHSESVKEFEARSSAIAQQEQELTKQREFVATMVKSIVPPPPPPELIDPHSPKYDPQTYLAQRAQNEAWTNWLRTLDAQQAEAEQAKSAKQAETAATRAKEEWGKLVERVPDLKDQAKAESFAKELVTIGEKYGFTEQELATRLPQDHRMALALRDASKWERFQAQKAKAKQKTEGKAPVLKGGARLDPQRAQARQGRAAMERLDQSGSLKDGIAALLALEKE